METGRIIQALVPFYIVLAVGYIYGKLKGSHRRALTSLLIYVFMPPLLFYGTYTSGWRHDSPTLIILFSAVSIAALAGAWLMVRILRIPAGPKRNMIYFCSFASNCANFGIPVLLFLEGKKSIGGTALIILANSILIYTIGIYILTSGRTGKIKAAARIFKNPLAWAVILGLTTAHAHIKPPARILKTLELLGDAAVPLMIILLGMALSEIKIKGFPLKEAAAAVVAKLLLMPAAALVALNLCNNCLSSTYKTIFTVESAAPVALVTIVLAEYYGEDTLLAACIVATTSLAVWITLPIFL